MRYLIYYKLKFATKMRDNAFLSKCKVPFYRNKSYKKTAKARLSFVVSAKKELGKEKSMLLPCKMPQKALAKPLHKACRKFA